MIDSPTDTEDAEYRAREARARREARKQGLAIERSRTRNPHSITYGTYWLVDPYNRTVVAGDTMNGYGMSLDAIEKALDE